MAIALVTGTSSGLGLATAVSLARAGHTVTATMRNLDGGADLRQIIAKEKLPITLTAPDVDDDDSVHDAFAKVVAEHGWIDILVNNAGIPGAAGGVEEIPFNVFQQVMETNFFGALRCIKAVVPSMRERRKGTIVNITSLAGRIARASLAPYAASKWALEALSECIAQEMRAFNVRVAIVEPGVIATPILTKRVSDSSGWSLSPCPADRGPLRRQARQSHPAVGCRRLDPRHRRWRQLAASLPRRARRSAGA